MIIIYNIIAICTYFFNITNLLPFKLTKKQNFIIFTLLSITFFLFTPIIPQYITILLTICTSLFLCIYIKKREIGIFVALFGYFYGITLNNVLLFFYSKYIDPNIYSRQYPFTFMTIFFLILFITTKFLAWFLYKKINLFRFFAINKLFVPLILNLGLCITLCIFNIAMGNIIGYSHKIICFNAFIFFAYFCASSFLLYLVYQDTKKLEQEKQLEKENKILSGYIMELEKSYAAVRKLKHDYDNVLISIGEYIESNNLSALKAYFNKEVLPYSKQYSYDSSFSQLSNLEVPQLKSLFAAKLFQAINTGISVHLEIYNPITSFSEPLIHFVRILGIFLDNAIEAAAQTQEKRLHIALIKNKSNITVIIKNTTQPLLFPLSDLCKASCTTKGAGHGLGLGNAQDLISQHPEVLWTTLYENNEFIQKLEIQENPL